MGRDVLRWHVQSWRVEEVHFDVCNDVSQGADAQAE